MSICFQVFDDPSYAEKLTGLEELQRSVDDIDVDWISDDDSGLI